jgi:integral membrane protein (TIGR01906 family)
MDHQQHGASICFFWGYGSDWGIRMTIGKIDSTLSKGLSWLVTVLIPIILVLSAVRLVLSPIFLEFEYRTPGFPQDPHGFYLPPELENWDTETRIHLADIAREYLLNDANISFLADLRFPEGQHAPPLSCQYMDDCTRLYNDRELQHMIDVKEVTQGALRVWYFSIAAVLSMGLWGWFGGWWEAYKRGVTRGGWLTVILIAAILLLVILAFGIFFVAFHQVFFQPGTWVFLPSDTLIRLFPERFWRDIFLVVGVTSAVLGAGLALVMGKINASRQTF